MSTQRGNVAKLKAPKHKNKTAFKNDLHDTSRRCKAINEIEHYGICNRCKDIIDWKVKYKKYKMLTTPKKCVKCLNKKVLHSYYIVCQACCVEKNVCSKCSKPCDELEFGESKLEAMKKEQEFQRELKLLPERQRRKFLRLLEKGLLTKENLDKLDEFKKDPNNNEDDEDFDDEDSEDEVEDEEGESEGKKKAGAEKQKDGDDDDEDDDDDDEDEENDSDDDYENEYEDELDEEEE